MNLPSRPKLERSLSFSHTGLVTLQKQKLKIFVKITISISRFTFMQTGISGNTLRYTLVPFKIFNFFMITSCAVVSCLALSLAPFPLIRIPHSPYASVVPFVDPPVGIGIRPLCRLAYFTCFGARSPRPRVKIDGSCWHRARPNPPPSTRRERDERQNIVITQCHGHNPSSSSVSQHDASVFLAIIKALAAALNLHSH